MTSRYLPSFNLNANVGLHIYFICTNYFSGTTMTRGGRVTVMTFHSCTDLPSSRNLPLTTIKIPRPNAAEESHSQFTITLTFQNVLLNADAVTVKVYVPVEVPTEYKTKLKFCSKRSAVVQSGMDKLVFSCECYNADCPFVGVMVLNHNDGLNVKVCSWNVING